VTDPTRLTAEQLSGAIESLALLVEAEGDFDNKATLAAATYRSAARLMSFAWASEHVGPIITRVRERALGLGKRQEIERILKGIPQLQARQRATEDLGRGTEELLAVAARSDDWIDHAAEEIASDPRCGDVQSANPGAIAEIIRRHAPGLGETGVSRDPGSGSGSGSKASDPDPSE
jgi:hypothetical protein